MNRQVVHLLTLILLLLSATFNTITMSRTLPREANGAHELFGDVKIGVTRSRSHTGGQGKSRKGAGP
ncbi:hypothetical protein HA466_0308710 [Hirschfeldia incana]|nr:hypothetical protein HA466_0308710 [Hirschfeldia incana]